jgi:endonuclease-8
VPEGDTIFRTARTLQRAIGGQEITRFETMLPGLARVEIDLRVTGRSVEWVEPRGKWLLMHFSGGLILLTHLQMNGSWHIYRPGERWKRRRSDMRILIGTPRMLAVAFSVQIAEFHSAASVERRKGLAALGPALLDERFDEEEAVRRLRGMAGTEIGDALLSQSALAGIGNIFKSETCFTSRVNPFCPVACLSDADLLRIVRNARQLLLANAAPAEAAGAVTYFGARRTTGRADPAQELWVYQRRGEPCRRCGTPIEARKQGAGARTTFWCPLCQPAAAKPAAAR